MAGDTAPTVWELQEAGVLFVEDGNHGEYRPLPGEFVSGGVAFIRAADLADGLVLFSTCDHINADAAARVRKGIGAPHDLILSHKGTVGKLARVGPEAPPFVCSPQTTIWRTLDTSRLDRGFLYAFLRSPDFLAQLRQVQGETDMAPYVSLTAQRRFRVPLPEIGIQRRIGQLLGSLDDKIALNRHMAATLEEMARALFKSWFVDFDPVRAKAEGRDPGLSADTAALFPSRFGEDGLPEGWQLSEIAKFFDLVGGGTPKTSIAEYWDGDIPWFSVVDAPTGSAPFVLTTERSISRAGLESCASPLVPDGATIITARGTVGKLAIACVPMAFNQSCYAALPHAKLGPFFVYYVLCNAINELTARSHGSVFSTITRQTFVGLTQPFGSFGLAKAFNETVTPFMDDIRARLKQSIALKDLRDTLLPKLISGQLRIKDAEAAVEAA